MKAAELVEFPESEEAFRSWTQRFPFGHVINAWKVPSNKPDGTRSLTWHRADCTHIGPDERLRYVTGDTMKACSANPAALAIWAKSRPESLLYCPDCRNAWLRDQAHNQAQ